MTYRCAGLCLREPAALLMDETGSYDTWRLICSRSSETENRLEQSIQAIFCAGYRAERAPTFLELPGAYPPAAIPGETDSDE